MSKHYDQGGKQLSVGDTGNIAFTIINLYSEVENGVPVSFADIKLTDGHAGVLSGNKNIIKRIPVNILKT